MRFGGIFDSDVAQKQLDEIEKTIADSSFWEDPSRSESVMGERKRLTGIVETEKELITAISDIETFVELAQEGEPVEEELEAELNSFLKRLEEIETDALLGGESDHCNAIVVLHPGAGGTEAQDWAQILLRMYLRWAERHDFKSEVSDMLPGDEAGIKSATFILKGENAYGMMRSEIGVHRLVRISPFDSNSRRHTSFASVFVYPEVDDDISIDIRADDLRVDTYRASGAGGQHVNRTDSAVRITHLPTNIVVQCQNERSQHKNKSTAMKMLRSRLYALELRKKQSEFDKIEASKADINFGSQIRNYVLAPYQLVKDLRSQLEVGDVERILDGDLDSFMHAFLIFEKTGRKVFKPTADKKAV